MSQSETEGKRVIWANTPELNKGFQSNKIVTTKYNMLTFLPFALFIQFRRVSNIYFLITAILQSIPQISPLQPFTAIAPLVFVLGVSLIREGIEDYLKYKSDREINNSPTRVYKRGAFEEIAFCKIQVGDVVLVRKNEVFPCDIVMLSNSNDNGIGYIETSSLDGEKALKPRKSFKETALEYSDKRINRICGLIEAELPNANLYSFSGSFEYRGKVHSLDKANLLLAGAFLRNTDWAIGISLYTGRDTRLRQNMMERKYKESRIEKTANKYILLILLMQFCLCFTAAVASGVWVSRNIHDHKYIRYPESYDIYDQGGAQGVLSYFTYFLLLNTMLPISLIISLELLKLSQGFFMMMDLTMYSEKRDRCCNVSSFSLNEELGMIKHIFSDKTGTLTCNQMEFKFFCTGNRSYGDSSHLMNFGLKTKVTYEDRDIKVTFNDKNIENDLFASSNSLKLNYPLKLDIGEYKVEYQTQQEIARQMMRCMALCHECIVEIEEREVVYTGPSPDDIVLVDTAKRLGFQLDSIKLEKMSLKITPFRVEEEAFVEVYDRICILEFNSDRKRMSVVLQDLNSGRYLIFTKGADLIMFRDVLSKDLNDEKYVEFIKKHVDVFSTRGLRTLVLGFKYINQSEFIRWKQKYDHATTMIEGRQKALDEVSAELEQDMLLLGCTSVEDSLQEDVPATIQDILRAGMSFWMLTGDKLETAENIGTTCSLIDSNMHVERCTATKPEECFESLQKSIENFKRHASEKQLALIIEGPALGIILYNHSDLEDRKKNAKIFSSDEKINLGLQSKNFFIEMADMCKTVICCRVSPSQKREVVKIIKDHYGKVTLSIGDGANDVPMILEAHIGVGLYGEEGIQAVQASDYALGEFKYLWELLLVHGRFNYMRQSEMILYFFYKNLVFTIPQFLFSHYCAYSGQTVYDDWYLTFYNLVFTALPLFMRALFERDFDVPKRYECSGEGLNESKKELRHLIPLTYSLGSENQLFTLNRFILWTFNGIFHSFIVFFIPLYAASEGSLNSKGHGHDLWGFSISSFSSIIIIVNIKLAINTKLWNKFHYICMFGLSIALYFIFILIYDVVTYTSSFQTVYTLIGTHYYYFCIMANVALVCVIDVAGTLVYKMLRPTESDILVHHFKQKKLDPKPTGFSQSYFEHADNNGNNNIVEKNIPNQSGGEFTYQNKMVNL
jgi:phospholipid-translocating P-type ATPase (flippase)